MRPHQTEHVSVWWGRVPHLISALVASGYLRRTAAAIWMNVLIAVVVAIAAVTSDTLLPAVPHAGWSVRAITVFAIWLLAFVPGWLYVRFLGQRAGALWNEYVLNLYRLGVDAPKYLPPPPPESEYSALPDADSGGDETTNIYRQKFNAYYGRRVSSQPADADDFAVNVETLFPVFLCTVTLAVAWTVLLWNPSSLVDPAQPWAGLEYGYLGAYAFAISMLVRRFYQSDLRPSAYASVVLRIVLVMLILVVLHQLFGINHTPAAVANQIEFVSAFVVGFFPLAGLQALQRVAAKALHVVVPQMAPEYPLDQLDGLNIWYEARLVEEGVEDMQNLTTMNLVDMLLHTRAPVGRLIDWIDQAFLLIHLDGVTRDQLIAARAPQAMRRPSAKTRVALRRVGVRSATDLLKVFDTDEPARRRGGCGVDPYELETLVRLLKAESGLVPVWNWKAGGCHRSTGERSA